VDQNAVTELVNRELQAIRDPAICDLVQRLHVDPYPVVRGWDYGAAQQRYTCWTVLEHLPSNTGVAYCDAGFGPTCAWGLVFLVGPHMNIGMDSEGFSSLECAVRGSMAWEGENPSDYQVERTSVVWRST
jgi:hypothetical protein